MTSHFLYACNPFLVNIPILYRLKTQENPWFRGVRNGNIGQKCVNNLNDRTDGHA